MKDASQNELSELTWVYDDAGWAASEAQKLGTDTKTVSYQYDDTGRVEHLTYPGRKVLALEYDALYRLKKIKEGGNEIGAYTYNEVGQPTRLDLLNGTRADYSYDGAGRLTQVLNRVTNGPIISSFTYTRTDEGDPTRITYHDGRWRDYTYDAAHRLTHEEHTKPNTDTILWNDYEYDDAGNRTLKEYDSNDGPELVYTKDTYGLNQLAALDGGTGSKVDVTGTVSDENLASVTVRNLTTEGEFGRSFAGRSSSRGAWCSTRAPTTSRRWRSTRRATRRRTRSRRRRTR